MAYTLNNKGTELIKELKRSDWIPKYNEDGINTLFDEMDSLMEQIIDIYADMTKEIEEAQQTGDAVTDEQRDIEVGYNTMLNIHHCTFYHEKRCLLAYLKYRLDKIREYRWEKSNILPEKVQSLLSKGEIKFFRDYDHLLNSYMQRTGFDLSSNIYPPKSLYVEVVATEDIGEIVTATGTVNKNSIHYLPLADIEYLVRQGLLVVKKVN